MQKHDSSRASRSFGERDDHLITPGRIDVRMIANCECERVGPRPRMEIEDVIAGLEVKADVDAAYLAKGEQREEHQAGNCEGDLPRRAHRPSENWRSNRRLFTHIRIERAAPMA